MKTLVHFIQHSIFHLGRSIALLVFVMMLVVCSIVVLRNGFKLGLIALQESITYLHALFFMLGVAFTLQEDEHVRVDIFYQNFSTRKKAWINALGCIIFLLPMCGFIFFNSWSFVQESWQMRETSSEPGGIAAIFLLKALIPLMALSLILQALADLINNGYYLMSNKNMYAHQTV